MSAVEDVLALFAEAPIVGLAEKHGIEQGAAFIEDVVRHPAFAATIAIEFGNAIHQGLADAYLAGEDVDPSPIWRDLVGAGPMGFREPIYPRFFAVCRQRRLRVVLGDPPLDWRIATPASIDAALRDRDRHFAQVVSELAGPVLLLAGDFHLFRRPIGPPNVIQLLEAARPGSTRSIGAFGPPRPGEPPVPAMTALEARLAGMPVPSLLRADGWLGEQPMAAGYGAHVMSRDDDGTWFDPVLRSPYTLGELCDGYLYLGPLDALTRSPFDKQPIDEADRIEIARRTALFPSF